MRVIVRDNDGDGVTLGERLVTRGATRFGLLGAALALLVTSAKETNASPAPRSSTTLWHSAATAPSSDSVTQVANAFLASRRAALRLDGVRLVFGSTLGVHGAHIVRYGQEHAGIPVYGGGLALWVDRDGGVRAVVGDARPLAGDPTYGVTREQAIQRIDELVGRARAQNPVLVWWRGSSGAARLVWRIDAATSKGAERFLVDAKGDGWFKRMPLGRHALGRVSRGGSLTSPEFEDIELERLDPEDPARLRGWNGQLDVANYMKGGFLQGHVDYQQTLEPNIGGDFLFSPPANPLDAKDGFAQVSLYEQVTRMRGVYERLGVDFSPPSWRLLVVANMQEHGNPFDNAYYAPLDMGGELAAPNFIGIGQGSLGDFAVDPDVAMHEFTHYVNHNAINFNQGWYWTNQYGLSPWASAIDEGVADYFACSESEDPVLGDVVLEAYGLVRRLDDASKRCPDDLGGEPHADGELIGSLGWTLRDHFGRERADRLMWSATTLLGPNATLGDFGRGLKLAAEHLEALGEFSSSERAVLEMLIMQRGLDDCDAVLDVTPSGPRHVLLATGTDGLGFQCGELRNQGFFQQALFQFRATPPPGSIGMTIRVELQSGSPSALSWSVFARRGVPVGMNDDGFLPRVEVFHHSVRNITTRTAELVIDATRLPEFDPSEPYYFTIEHQNCLSSAALVSVEYTWSEGGGGAGGAAGTGGAGGNGESGGAGGYSTGGQPEPAGGQPGDAQELDERGSSCAFALPRGEGSWRLVFGFGLILGSLVRRRRGGRRARGFTAASRPQTIES